MEMLESLKKIASLGAVFAIIFFMLLQPSGAQNTPDAAAAMAAQQMNGNNDVPASQIIAVLRQRPDLLEQVKTVASIQLQNEGELSKGSVLSDEALYARI